MGFYPISLDIKDKLCVVIGNGSVGAGKAKALLEAGAKVKIIERPYKKGDLDGAFLAIAATDNEEVNVKVAEDAKKLGILLNVVDKPAISNFYNASVVKRGDLVISISTGGKFPALSKKLRKEFSRRLGPEYEEYLEVLAKARNKVIAKYADLNKRKAKLEQIARLPLIELIKRGKAEEAKEKVSSCI